MIGVYPHPLPGIRYPYAGNARSQIGLPFIRVDGCFLFGRLVAVCRAGSRRDFDPGPEWRLDCLGRCPAFGLFRRAGDSLPDRRAWYRLGDHHFAQIQQGHALYRNYHGRFDGHCWRDDDLWRLQPDRHSISPTLVSGLVVLFPRPNILITVTLYTRKDCHFCEQAKADLESIQAQHPHRLVEIDIESDPVLHQKYLIEIPVAEIGPYRLKAPLYPR